MTKLVCLSDTHSYHNQINVPAGDILIHAGDITYRGEMDVIEDFVSWIKRLPHKYKIVVFGNHELGMENGPKRDEALSMLAHAGIFYFENSRI